MRNNNNYEHDSSSSGGYNNSEHAYEENSDDESCASSVIVPIPNAHSNFEIRQQQIKSKPKSGTKNQNFINSSNVEELKQSESIRMTDVMQQQMRGSYDGLVHMAMMNYNPYG